MRTVPTLLAIAVGLALAAGACGGSPTATPSGSAQAPSPPAPTDVPGGGDRTPGPTPGLLPNEAWGAAWDALPPGFPLPAGAKLADPGDPADGPTSGAFVIDGATDDVAAQMQRQLGAAGYSTEALSGPFEDGSLVINSVGPDAACRVQTQVRPLGGTTMITVLFGAACPWD